MIHTFRIALFIVLLLIPVACKADTDAAEKPVENPPYNSRTVEECIYEKACAKYEFFRLITQSNLEKRDDWRFSRWGGPIQIKIIGDDEYQYEEHIRENISILDRYFPGKITISDKKINLFIVFNDSIRKEFYGSDYAFWQGVFKEKVELIGAFIDVAQEKDPRCVAFAFHNKRLKKIAGLLFVERGSPKALSCIRKGLKGIFATPVSSLPYLAKYNLEAFSNHNINKLDLFLQALHYDPNFQANMTFSEIDTAFGRAYSDTFNRFKVQLRREKLP